MYELYLLSFYHFLLDKKKMLGFSTLGVVSDSQLDLVGALGSQNKKNHESGKTKIKNLRYIQLDERVLYNLHNLVSTHNSQGYNNFNLNHFKLINNSFLRLLI